MPGDVVLLAAGSLVPADGVILEAADFFVSEAVLTGESFPVEKRPGPVALTAGLRDRLNCVFLGTNARSGTARCLIVATGLRTQFGAIAHRLTLRPPETEFDRGLRRFGHLLTSAMLIMVFLVFIIHVVNGRPPIETLVVLGRARGWSEPRATPRDLERQPRSGCPDDGPPWRAGPSSHGHREPREHGRPLHGQNRDPDRRPGRAGRRVRSVGRAIGSRTDARCVECGTRNRTAQPARRRDPQRGRAGSVSRSKTRGDPVRLRPQARQRRRGDGRQDVPHHQGRVPSGTRDLHAIR